MLQHSIETLAGEVSFRVDPQSFRLRELTQIYCDRGAQLRFARRREATQIYHIADRQASQEQLVQPEGKLGELPASIYLIRALLVNERPQRGRASQQLVMVGESIDWHHRSTPG